MKEQNGGDSTASSALRAGVTESMVLEAVRRSGYPLQQHVAATLANDFRIEEEWAFTDPDGGGIRTIDLVASRTLWKWESNPTTRVRPNVELIIECKQSDMPYVFFLSDSASGPMKEFPLLGGLRTREIEMKTDKGNSTFCADVMLALSLGEHPFISEPARCMTFSKCARKGAVLELSGSDAYQNLVFPLIKASVYRRDVAAPIDSYRFFDANLIVPLAVIDGPMVGVQLVNGDVVAKPLDWVRIARHQPLKAHFREDRATVYGVDVVNKGYLRTYLDLHLMPFSEVFAERVLARADVLATGKGFAKGLELNPWGDLFNRLG